MSLNVASLAISIVIPLLLHEYIPTIFSGLYYGVFNYLGLRQCDELCWEHLPSSVNLHRYCNPPSCIDISTERNASLLQKQLNGCWDFRKINTHNLPRSLGTSKKYLKTDVRVLFAFFLSAADSREGGHTDLTFAFRDTKLKFTAKDDFFVAQIETGRGNEHYSLTKLDVEQIMTGALPCFRQTMHIPSHNGSPALTLCPDIDLVGVVSRRRGGCVFAAGLAHSWVPVWVKAKSSTVNEDFDKKDKCGGCIVYALDVIESKIRPLLTSPSWTGTGDDLSVLSSAVSAINMLMKYQSGSAWYVRIRDTPLGELWHSYNGFALSPEDCHLAISIFSKKSELLPKEIELLQRQLYSVLVVILRGIDRIYDHRNRALHLDISTLFFENKDVYLPYE